LLNELTEEQTDIVLKEVIVDLPTHQYIETIKFTNLHYQMSENISLEFNGTVTIPIEKQLILVNGETGTGKTTVVRLMTGEYDGSCTDSFEVNGNPEPEEFRSIRNARLIVRQEILEDYQRNEKGTLTMSLGQLFPMASYEEIRSLLVGRFGMACQFPKNMTDPISMTANSPSGGEKRAFVLVSQLWMALKTNTKIVFLDEPDNAIDVNTAKKIFDWMWEVFEGTTFFVIVHEESIKTFFKDRHWVSQEWIFPKLSEDLPRTFSVLEHDE
jgi:ABC-type multidrug transport system ATPase subunit